ncbi:MAG: phosphoglycerate mutase family protein [Alphaproteobacteria bacterium]|nr:phosphoglycerate mutase family protein [Alphaproteobacteria bacterium]
MRQINEDEKKFLLPLNIYLVRHGQTEGNVDRKLYAEKADHAILLTERGIRQAEEVGDFFARLFAEQRANDPEGFGSVRVWHSPYYRARQTAYYLLQSFPRHIDNPSSFVSYREEPFLFEQKGGYLDGCTDEEIAKLFPEAAKDHEKHCKYNGRTYSPCLNGESRMETAIRTKLFFQKVLSDYRERNIRHVVVVCHGVTARAFTLGWMHYSPEWMDAEKNPSNCWVRHIEGTPKTGYIDHGYIYGEGAPLNDVMATQRQLDNAQDIFMLKPQRPNAIIPKGVKCFDPFARRQP